MNLARLGQAITVYLLVLVAVAGVRAPGPWGWMFFLPLGAFMFYLVVWRER